MESQCAAVKPQICNMCGKPFDEFDTCENFKLEHNVGYGSKHDMDIINCHLCCKCFDRLLDEYLIPKCKHNIIVGTYKLTSINAEKAIEELNREWIGEEGDISQ